jgi:hypothetical protein
MVARRRDDRGASTLGCLFSIMILMVVLYYAVDIGRVYWDFYKFQDEMETSARFAQTQSDDQIRAHLRDVARELGLPTEAQRIVIRRSQSPHNITIRSQYVVDIELPFTHKTLILRPSVEVPLFQF